MPRRVTLRERLIAVARAAVGAVEGGRLVALAVPLPVDRVWAVGKAAAAMAQGALAAAPGVTGGLVIAKAGGGGPIGPLRLLSAAHPVPDARSVAAAGALLAEACALAADAHALLLLSGGASSLVGAPLPPLTLEAVSATTRALVRGGEPIHAINVVRRHLGLVLGGRLAAACAGRITALALSDVAGDDPAAIGSGPVSPDPTTLADALAIARRHAVPEAVLRALDGGLAETPKPGDRAFERVSHRILANPHSLLRAAIAELSNAGLVPRVRDTLVAGPVEAFADELLRVADALAPGEVWVAVGEPTVEVRGDGVGGRAQHLALLVAERIAARALAFVACGSDGSDGPTDAAGAAVDGDTWHASDRSAWEQALARFDAHPWLQAKGALVVTGPTGTNLNDLFLLARAA